MRSEAPRQWASASGTTRTRTSSPTPAPRRPDTGGRISRYFYGIEYAPRDLRLGLVEASAGRIGSRRPGPSLLLSLRPVERQVRCRRADAGPGRRLLTVGAFGRLDLGHDPRRARESRADAPLSRTGLELRGRRRRAVLLPHRRHRILLAADRGARRLLRDQVSPALARRDRRRSTSRCFSSFSGRSSRSASRW